MAADDITKLKKRLVELESKADKGAAGQEKVETLNKLAFAFHRSDPEKTEVYGRQSLVLAEKLDFKEGVATSHLMMALSYLMRSDYDQALEHSFKSLKIFEEEEDAKGVAGCYRNMGNVYRDRGDGKKALGYYRKSLKICEEIGDRQGGATSYNNIGLVYDSRGSCDKALKYFLKALKIREEIGEEQWIAASYNNIGIVYYKLGNYNKALEYQREALKIREGIADKHGKILSCNDIGLVYIQLKRYGPASNYFNKGVELAAEIGARNLEMICYEGLSRLYEAQEDFRKAFDYYKKASELKAEIFNEESARKMTQIQVRYETEQKEEEAELYRLKTVELEQWVAERTAKLSAEVAERKRTEEVLLESEEKYRNLVERANDGITIVVDFEIRYANKRLLKMLGYREDELVNKPFVEFIEPGEQSRIQEYYKKRMAREEVPLVYETVILHKDGSCVRVEMNVGIIAYQGKPAEFVFVRDITERKKAEEERDRHGRELQALFQGVDLLLWSVREDDDGELYYEQVNEAFAAVEGKKPEDLSGKQIRSLYSSQEYEKIERAFSTAKQGKLITKEIEFKGDTPKVFEMRYIPLADDKGVINRMIGVGIDITERKRVEQALRESEEKFRGLAESAKDIIYSLSLDGTVLYINPAVKDLMGIEPEKVIGRKFLEMGFISSQTKEAYRTQLEHILKHDSVPLFEIELKTTTGSKRVLEFSARKLSNIIVGVARDITKRKQMEQQLLRASKLVSVGVLAAGIAHQVNNPLAIMLSASTVLRDLLESYPQAPDDLQQEAFKYLGILEKQVDRTQQVVSGLLGFTQTRPSQIQSVDVNALVTDVTRFLSQSLSSRNLEVELSLYEQLPQAMVDPVALQQVVVNIVQNALDAIEHKGKLVLKTEREGNKILITVADNGPGVPPELQERIFEPLFSTKDADKGCGLGLSVSIMLLESFGGCIRYEDGPGGGAVFIVEVPETGEEYNESWFS